MTRVLSPFVPLALMALAIAGCSGSGGGETCPGGCANGDIYVGDDGGWRNWHEPPQYVRWELSVDGDPITVLCRPSSSTMPDEVTPMKMAEKFVCSEGGATLHFHFVPRTLTILKVVSPADWHVDTPIRFSPATDRPACCDCCPFVYVLDPVLDTTNTAGAGSR